MISVSRSTYSSVAIGLHWTIGILIILNVLGGLFHESFGDAVGGAIIGFHKSSGILILVLSVARLIWRLTHRPPPLAASVKGWEKGLAHATHWTFYALMFALPLTGWLMVSAGARKYPLDFYGLFPIPFLPVVQDKVAAHTYNERHELLGYVIAALILLHIAAALKHHLFDKDNTLARMLPVVRGRDIS
jgi:cytochrome b561